MPSGNLASERWWPQLRRTETAAIVNDGSCVNEIALPYESTDGRLLSPKHLSRIRTK